MDDRIAKAFDFAQETTKQLIALSTGVIALSITFAKDFAVPGHEEARIWALRAWGFLLASLLFGLWTLLALTGTLEPKTPPAAAAPSIRGGNVALPAAAQIICFFIGMALIVLYGVRATS